MVPWELVLLGFLTIDSQLSEKLLCPFHYAWGLVSVQDTRAELSAAVAQVKLAAKFAEVASTPHCQLMFLTKTSTELEEAKGLL